MGGRSGWSDKARAASAAARASGKSEDHAKAAQARMKAAGEATNAGKFLEAKEHRQAAVGHQAQTSHVQAAAKEASSEYAGRKSAIAERTGTSVDHTAAHFAHKEAARVHTQLGHHAEAAYHTQQAQHHWSAMLAGKSGVMSGALRTGHRR